MRCWMARLLLGEGVELVHQPLGMDPTQGVPADIELAGIVADDHRVGEQAVRLDAAPQRALRWRSARDRA